MNYRVDQKLNGRNTLSEHVEYNINRTLYKPWEEYYSTQTNVPDLEIYVKSGLDMSVEEKFGKVLGNVVYKNR